MEEMGSDKLEGNWVYKYERCDILPPDCSSNMKCCASCVQVTSHAHGREKQYRHASECGRRVVMG
jgi:hypothetical protein